MPYLSYLFIRKEKHKNKVSKNMNFFWLIFKPQSTVFFVCVEIKSVTEKHE